MSQTVRFSIPIKPHLRAYLADYHELPYVLNMRDHLGLYIYQMLRRRRFRDTKYFSIRECTDSMEVIVSDSFAWDAGCLLMHDYQVYLINIFIEQMMMEHAITWVRAAEMAGMNNRQAIYRWVELYNLDEGSSDWYHRIKKLYFRFRKKHEKSQKSTCPPVPVIKK